MTSLKENSRKDNNVILREKLLRSLSTKENKNGRLKLNKKITKRFSTTKISKRFKRQLKKMRKVLLNKTNNYVKNI